QVERMRMALAAIADDRDLLALDQVQVGVAVVVNAHDSHPRVGDLAARRPVWWSPAGSPRRAPGSGRPCLVWSERRYKIAPTIHIASGPRDIATIPVRATSTSPRGSISSTNWSILSGLPVISNTKLSVVASITRARKASPRRSAS